ncbi:HNH endonuclease signature motif containing protein [Xanthomonas sp. SHU 199]|uniref:HNH endonuclease signature motif containing protein n=1 Tax=Xanthomonas sp. SHU 199 TaxID=1591174 RepID=UPI0018E3C25D
MSPKRGDIGNRLESLSIPVPEAGCWLWIGRMSTNGYGRIGIGRNKQYRAHRISWEHHFGPIPDGMYVCHKCDVRSCINPDHLFIGTAKDNARDREAKGRGVPYRGGGGWNRGMKLSVTHPNGAFGKKRETSGGAQ